MSENTEKIELDCETAKRLRQLSEQNHLSISELLEGLSSYLPLLCELTLVGDREYKEFATEYKALIGAEDCFLSTMSYHDFTKEETAPPPGCNNILRALLGIAYWKAASNGEMKNEEDISSIIAAVSEKL